MATPSSNQQLVIPQKTTKTYQLKFKQNGANVNITGWTIFFTAKDKMNDTDDNAKIKKTVIEHTDPINGETEVSLSSSDTNIEPGPYYYDIMCQDNDVPANRLLVINGRLTIEKTVTTREI